MGDSQTIVGHGLYIVNWHHLRGFMQFFFKVLKSMIRQKTENMEHDTNKMGNFWKWFSENVMQF